MALEVSHVMFFTVYLSFFTLYGFWARGCLVLSHHQTTGFGIDLLLRDADLVLTHLFNLDLYDIGL